MCQLSAYSTQPLPLMFNSEANQVLLPAVSSCPHLYMRLKIYSPSAIRHLSPWPSHTCVAMFPIHVVTISEYSYSLFPLFLLTEYAYVRLLF